MSKKFKPDIKPEKQVEDESQKLIHKHMNYCKDIQRLNSEGFTTQEIASKLYIAELFVKDILEKGSELWITQLTESLKTTKPPDKTKDKIIDKVIKKSSQKKEIKKTIKSTEYSCAKCLIPLIEGKPTTIKGFLVRTMQCEKCKESFYNPADFDQILNRL